MTKRSCYQCGDDDLDAIRQKRNEEIRAYGKKVLADADAALLSPIAAPNNDWEFLEEDLEVEADPDPDPEPVTEVSKTRSKTK